MTVDEQERLNILEDEEAMKAIQLFIEKGYSLSDILNLIEDIKQERV